MRSATCRCADRRVSGRPLQRSDVRHGDAVLGEAMPRPEAFDRFRSAFETAAHGMAIVGLDGRFIEVNRALCDILGYSADELHALNFQTITHPDDLDADIEQVANLLKGDGLS